MLFRSGPVVVGAVILHPNKTHELLRDSKIMTAQQREIAFAWITQNAWFSFAVGDVATIERINILQTTKQAMRQSFVNVMAMQSGSVRYLLIDAVPLDIPSTYLTNGLTVESFPFGESRSISIAAASIVAKVVRDTMMQQFESSFPGYGLIGRAHV